MNPKTIKTLAVIFIGLILIIFEINWLEKPSDKKASIKPDFNLTGISEEKSEKVIISNKDGKKEITKTGDGWMIGGKKVSAEEIGKLFGEIKNLEILEVVSKNKKNHENFGFGEGEVYSLDIAINGGKSQKLLIGKSGTKNNSFYVKKEGSDKVYLAGGSLRNQIAQNEEAWMEKKEEDNAQGKANEEIEK